MKRSLELLLVLPLLLAIIFLIFAIQNGTVAQWFATPISVATKTSTARAAPIVPTSVTLQPTSSVTPSRAATLTSRPTATSTYTPSPIPSATRTATPVRHATFTIADAALSEEINSGFERGNEIVRALEAYSQDQGRYPATLEELVPVHLPALPLTITGQPYFYRLFDAADILAPEIYWLSFRVTEQENVTCTYLRRLEYWDCNFASP